jgi:hypothetical protein
MIHCKNKIELGKHPNHLISLKIKNYYFINFCGMSNGITTRIHDFFY